MLASRSSPSGMMSVEVVERLLYTDQKIVLAKLDTAVTNEADLLLNEFEVDMREKMGALCGVTPTDAVEISADDCRFVGVDAAVRFRISSVSSTVVTSTARWTSKS